MTLVECNPKVDALHPVVNSDNPLIAHDDKFFTQRNEYDNKRESEARLRAAARIVTGKKGAHLGG